MRFELAPRDRLTSITTALWIPAGLLLAGVAYWQTHQWQVLLGLAVWIALYGIIHQLGPTGYYLDSAEIRIERPIGPIRIPLHQVRGARAVDLSPLQVTKQTGASGLVAYVGRFSSRALGGSFKAFATTLSPAVLVDTMPPYLISPADRDFFLRQLEGHLAARGR